jgi:four helix bundle protein
MGDFAQLFRRRADDAGMSETQNREQATGNRQQAIQIKKGSDIAERLLRLGVGILKLGRTLPRDLMSRHVALQLVRSGTSMGANYEEARAAESRADFAHKVSIAAKEARETIYWLRLVHEAGMSRESVSPLIDETWALAAILIASRRTARAGLVPEPP